MSGCFIASSGHGAGPAAAAVAASAASRFFRVVCGAVDPRQPLFQSQLELRPVRHVHGGNLVWELVHSWEPGSSLMRWGELAAIAGFVANLAWIAYASSPHGPTLWTYTPSLFVSSSALLLCAVHHDGILWRVLSWRQLRWVGNMSYSYYLTHGMIIKGIRSAMRMRPGEVLSSWTVIGLLAGCELAAWLDPWCVPGGGAPVFDRPAIAAGAPGSGEGCARQLTAGGEDMGWYDPGVRSLAAVPLVFLFTLSMAQAETTIYLRYGANKKSR